MTLKEFRELTKDVPEDIELIVVDGEYGEFHVSRVDAVTKIIVQQKGTQRDPLQIWISPDRWGKDGYTKSYWEIHTPAKDYLRID